MTKLSLQQSKDRFIKFGKCDHEEQFEEKSIPYNTNIELTLCKVCNKVKSKVYLC